jgi:hypothetical protein
VVDVRELVDEEDVVELDDVLVDSVGRIVDDRRSLASEPCWDRTSDPLLKRQMLYRLS